MSENKAHLLIVDDDERILSLLSAYLSKNNFLISSANNSTEARCLLDYFAFDLLVIDIMMPGESGLELLENIRKQTNVPAIFLSAKGESKDKISGLEIGSDDYISKPFEPKELILRINNILKKTQSLDIKRVIEFGNIKIDLKKQFIYKNDLSIKINNTEKMILEKMINTPGKIYKREEIADLINLDKERSIDVIVTRLRKKIEESPKNPKYLQTIRGEGYVLWIE